MRGYAKLKFGDRVYPKSDENYGLKRCYDIIHEYKCGHVIAKDLFGNYQSLRRSELIKCNRLKGLRPVF